MANDEFLQKFGEMIHAVAATAQAVNQLTVKVNDVNTSVARMEIGFEHANADLIEVTALVKKIGNTTEADFAYIRDQHGRHLRRLALIDQIKMVACGAILIAALGWFGIAILAQAKIELLTGGKDGIKSEAKKT